VNRARFTGPAEFADEFKTFTGEAFRLETLQDYAEPVKDPQWAVLVAAGRRAGKAHRRVHIAVHPLTGYMQWELTDGYEPNVAAGEDIRIIPVAPGEPLPDVPGGDFWLFDSSRLYLMHYDPAGKWLGAERVTGPGRIAEACRVRDAALARSIPWPDYIAAHPDLLRRVAA
jgi:Family of unknown function (DUF6879)